MLGTIRRFTDRLTPTDPSDLPDADLVSRFLATRDEAAFAAIVRRHGGMVFGVCRRITGHHHDAEDAFQATFLVLTCKAHTVRPASRLGAWLHGVAVNVARKAVAARRHAPTAPDETFAAIPTPVPNPGLEPDLPAKIDDALMALPSKYRAPVVLCHLEGCSRRDAAGRLGWSEGTLSGRLSRALDLLADRLQRRGVTVTTAGLVAALSADLAGAVPPALTSTTLKTAALVGVGAHALDALPGHLAALTRGAIPPMFPTQLKLAALGLFAASATAVAVTLPAPAPVGPAAAPAPAPKAGWRVIRTIRHADPVTAVAAGPGMVAVGDEAGWLKLYDPATGAMTRQLLDAVQSSEHSKPIDFVGIDAAGEWMFMVTGNRKAIHQVGLTPANKHVFPGSGGGDRTLYHGFSGDGSVVFETFDEKEVGAFTVVTTRENTFYDNIIPSIGRRATETDRSISLVVGNEDGSVVAIITDDGVCRVCKVGRKESLYTLPADLGVVSVAKFSPDGKQLAIAGDGWVAKVDVESGKVLANWKVAHKGVVTALAFTPDSQYLASGGTDGHVRFWEAAAKPVSDLKAHAAKVTAVGFSPDGKQLVTGSADQTAKVWEYRK
ncbi:MAG: sigma-70 family RNA polymerase sigma factor [Gemmataceae bacterium]